RGRQPRFRVVQEGSTVLLARNYLEVPNRPRHKQGIRQEVHKTPAQLIRALRESAPTPSANGTGRVVRIATDATVVTSVHKQPEGERRQPTSVSVRRRLGDIIQIRLGGVTGDAGY